MNWILLETPMTLKINGIESSKLIFEVVSRLQKIMLDHVANVAILDRKRLHCLDR